MTDNEFKQRVETNEYIAGLIHDLQRQLVEAQAERDALKEAAKTLQRVQFIIGGHSGDIAECDEAGMRLNITRALELMGEKLPPIVAALSLPTPTALTHLRAQLAEARAALEAIANLPVGACDMFDDLDATSWNEPCARCVEAHDIARAALLPDAAALTHAITQALVADPAPLSKSTPTSRRASGG